MQRIGLGTGNSTKKSCLRQENRAASNRVSPLWFFRSSPAGSTLAVAALSLHDPEGV